MIVLNGIADDSRVVKMASAMARICKPFTVLGTYPALSSNAGVRIQKIGALHCHLFPYRLPLLTRLKEETEEQFRLRRRIAAHDELKGRIVEFAVSFQPGCLHTHDMFALPIGADIQAQLRSQGHKPVWIHDVHEFAAGSTHMAPVLQQLALSYEETHMPSVDQVVTVTDELRAELLSRYPGLTDVQVIYNAPPAYPHTPSTYRSVRDALGLGGAHLAVYSGVVKAKRGVERMIPVLQRMPELHLAILSNSAETEFVQELQRRFSMAGVSERVHWHPYVQANEVPRFLQGADVGIIPIENYGNAEVALPTKLFEYVFAEIPVVSHSLKAIDRFLAQYPVGEAVDFGDPDAVVAAFRSAMTPAAKERAKQQAADVIKSFAWEVQERKLMTLYLEVMGDTPPRIIDAVGGTREQLSGVRVLHGISGAAGQPSALATAIDKLPGFSARSLQVTSSSFGYRPDMIFPLTRGSVEIFQEAMRAVVNDFDIFHLHFRGFFHDSRKVGFPVGLDLLALKAANKRLVIHFRGSEVRLQSVFQAKSPFNYVDEDAEGTVSKFPEPQKRMFIELASAIADRVFVTDHELATYVPGAHIVERAIDLKKWGYVGVTPTPRPLVIHAPSRRGVKGTASVLQAVENLRKRGVEFEFLLIEGMPNDEARKVYERADIVVDQLRIGWYGVLAVEAMALGKPCISYVRDDLVEHLGDELPLAIANPNTIEMVLEDLILDFEKRKKISLRARAYCEAVHSDEAVALKLARHYEEIWQSPKPVDINVVLDHIVRQNALLLNAGTRISPPHSSPLSRSKHLFRRCYSMVKNEGLFRTVKWIVYKLANKDGSVLGRMDKGFRKLAGRFRARS